MYSQYIVVLLVYSLCLPVLPIFFVNNNRLSLCLPIHILCLLRVPCPEADKGCMAQLLQVPPLVFFFCITDTGQIT